LVELTVNTSISRRANACTAEPDHDPIPFAATFQIARKSGLGVMLRLPGQQLSTDLIEFSRRDKQAHPPDRLVPRPDQPLRAAAGAEARCSGDRADRAFVAKPRRTAGCLLGVATIMCALPGSGRPIR
jgi:hypothetical protein